VPRVNSRVELDSLGNELLRHNGDHVAFRQKTRRSSREFPGPLGVDSDFFEIRHFGGGEGFIKKEKRKKEERALRKNEGNERPVRSTNRYCPCKIGSEKNLGWEPIRGRGRLGGALSKRCQKFACG